MLKYFIMMFIFVLFISNTYLFYLNKYYNQLIQETKELKKDLDLLNVEWMYLNQPKRIQELSKKLTATKDSYKDKPKNK